MGRRHVLLPDTQNKPGAPNDHVEWAAKWIAEHGADEIIIGGDWWDMPSMGAYDRPGSRAMEGARYRKDIDAGNAAFERFVAPLKRSRVWRKARKRFLFGNHEDRVTRAVNETPKLEGAISLDDMDTQGFERHAFLEVVPVDGVHYSHYFQSAHSPRAISGEVTRRIAEIGESFAQFHEQGFRYGQRIYPTGKIRHGIVAGSFYQHDEGYRGPQGRTAGHWSGIVVLNDVRDGNLDIMPISLDYLRREYGSRRKRSK